MRVLIYLIEDVQTVKEREHKMIKINRISTEPEVTPYLTNLYQRFITALPEQKHRRGADLLF